MSDEDIEQDKQDKQDKQDIERTTPFEKPTPDSHYFDGRCDRPDVCALLHPCKWCEHSRDDHPMQLLDSAEHPGSLDEQIERLFAAGEGRLAILAYQTYMGSAPGMMPWSGMGYRHRQRWFAVARAIHREAFFQGRAHAPTTPLVEASDAS